MTTPEVLKFSDLVKPTPRQRQFLDALKDHDFVLYGGAAGGGKSFILRWALVGLLMKWAKELKLRGVRVALFCEDFPALRERQVSKIEYEFPRWLGRYREQVHEFQLAERFGSGVICFRNLDDPSKYLSAEFAACAVDELTRNEQSTFDLLRFRMRWPGIERPKFMGATNPGGVGHGWCKRFWIDQDFPPELQSKADQFHFVQAKATDNPNLPSSYWEALQTLPPDLARAYADGSWDVFGGQIFAEFRREIHVIKPFEIPAWWRRWGSNDPGFSDASAWFWCAADQDGNVYCYREHTCERMPYSEQGKQVKALTGSENIDFWVVGMDGFVSNPETGKSIADYYKDAGLRPMRKPVHGRARALHGRQRCTSISRFSKVRPASPPPN